jgi:hypothetical protein
MTKKNRGHAFYQDPDWLSCGKRWQSLHLIIWHLRCCMLCSASSNNMRSDQWQTISFFFAHIFPQDLDRLSLDNNDQVFSWWYDMKEVVCSALLVPTTWEVTNDKQFQFAHTFSQDLDWLSLNNKFLVDGMIYKKLLLCPYKKLYALLCWC